MQLKRFHKRIVANFDWLIAANTLLIGLIGLGVLYSADFDRSTGESLQVQRQAVSMCLGIGAFLFAMTLSSSFWQRWAVPIFILGIVMLVATVSHGVVGGGAKRWLVIGGVRFQPAEFSKIGLILVFAKLFASEQTPRNGFTFIKLLTPGIIMLIPVLLVGKEDLGTALVHVFIGGSMLLLAGVQTKTLIRLAIVGCLLLAPAWEMLKDYQRQRIINFLSPEQDPLGTGYHAIQSKIAVGSGAVLGKGYLEGTQTQLRFLPEQTTDFIFSVLAEEWGFVGSSVLLLCYTFLILRLFRLSSQCQDRFSAFVVFGVGSLIFWQVVVNMGMVTGVLPVVGITLPLLSYGGSSLVSIFFALGLAVGLGGRKYIFAS